MTEQRIRAEFNEKLSNLLKLIAQKANEKLEHNLSKNLPEFRIEPEEVVDESILSGVVSGFTAQYKWCAEAGFQIAVAFLEDVNLHGEAQRLRDEV